MFKNLVYSVITKATIALINFLILIFSSRYLGLTSRGEISIFILNITVIQVINEVYTGYSIVHFIPKYNFRKIFITGFFYTIVFCTLSNLIIVFLHKQVPGYEWLGYLISLLVILNTFHCVLILGKENIKTYNLLSFLQPFILLLGIIFFIFVLEKYTFVSYVYPLLFSFSCAVIFSTAVTLNYFFKGNKITEFKLRPVLSKGLSFQAAILMFVFANRYSYYLLPDSNSVGLYSSGCSLMESVLIIVNAISPVVLAKVANQGNTDHTVNMTLSLSKGSFLMATLAVLIIFLLPAGIFTFVLGSGFAGIKNGMILYAPTVLMMSFFGIISSHLTAVGRQNLVLLCYGLGFLFTLILAPFLIRSYGVSGAALNANITYFVMTLGICFSFARLNKLSPGSFFSLSGGLKNLKTLLKY